MASVNLGRVLVVGGCGFLGHHIVKQLVEDYVPAGKATAVSVIDLRCTNNRRPDADQVAYFEADITDAARLVEVFQTARPDVVIHTASPAAQASSRVADALFYQVNVEGTRGVVEACKTAGVRCLVYTSSASILSDNRSDLINADERWPVIRGKQQTEYYSETKAAAEELVLAANDRSAGGLLTCSIRPSGIMGEGDTMQLFHMINVYRQRRHYIQVGANDNLFDFTYAGNVSHAHLLAAAALRTTVAAATAPLDHERVDGEAFLITNDSPVYFWDYCRTVWKYAGCTSGNEGIRVLPKDLGLLLGLASEMVFGLLRRPPTFNRQRIIYACMTRYYNIDKAKKRLGYKPIVSLEEGIKRGVEWSLQREKAVKA